MINGGVKELAIELELNRGVCRCGVQNYQYRLVSDLFHVPGLEAWPVQIQTGYAPI